MTLAEVDWRAMFANYVRIMWKQEGVDYLDRDDDRGEGRKWSDDERAAIDALLDDMEVEA